MHKFSPLKLIHSKQKWIVSNNYLCSSFHTQLSQFTTKNTENSISTEESPTSQMNFPSSTNNKEESEERIKKLKEEGVGNRLPFSHNKNVSDYYKREFVENPTIETLPKNRPKDDPYEEGRKMVKRASKGGTELGVEEREK
ncbi:hypothetical protein ABK040_011720 [Willaertia magna]